MHSTVRHAEWGTGMVMGYEEDRMTVLFDDVGYKTLSVPVVKQHALLVAAWRAPKGKPVTDEPLYSTWGFTDSEWGLLVGLPQAVLTAASAATPDSARKTRAENEAGLEKISEARASASPWWPASRTPR